MRPDLDLPRVVCEYLDVFPDELPGLPPQRVVDFGIEVHPGTSPISMTPHRMTPVELQELRVQLQELLDKVSRPDSRSDPIGGSEPVSGTRDSGLGLFFFFFF